MDPQRKVTAFLTRGSGATRELCVFTHAAAGIQVPAGTVEDGETYENAAWREAGEETGLTGLRLLDVLGVRRYAAPPGQGWITRSVALRTGPHDEAAPTSWTLGRTRVDIVAHQGLYARVVYRETAEAAEPMTYARLEGWVPESLLADTQERAFFHFQTAGSTPDTWSVQAEPTQVFELSWVPLSPMPTVLIGQQQEWLAEFHSALCGS